MDEKAAHDQRRSLAFAHPPAGVIRQQQGQGEVAWENASGDGRVEALEARVAALEADLARARCRDTENGDGS